MEIWWANPRWSVLARSGKISANSWGSHMLHLPLQGGASVLQSHLLGWKHGMLLWLGKKPLWLPAELLVACMNIAGMLTMIFMACLAKEAIGYRLVQVWGFVSQKESLLHLYVNACKHLKKKRQILLHCLKSIRNSSSTVCCQSLFILSAYTGKYNIYRNKSVEHLTKQGHFNTDVTKSCVPHIESPMSRSGWRTQIVFSVPKLLRGKYLLNWLDRCSGILSVLGNVLKGN